MFTHIMRAAPTVFQASRGRPAPVPDASLTCVDQALQQAVALLTVAGLLLTALAIVVSFSSGSKYGFNLLTSLFVFAAFLAAATTAVSFSAGSLLVRALACSGPGSPWVLFGLGTGVVTLPIAAWWIAVAVHK